MAERKLCTSRSPRVPTADLTSVQEAKIPVYAFREDLEERGIPSSELITGVHPVSRTELGKLIAEFDTVWDW